MRAQNFDDSTWASGPAQLGYGETDEATKVGFGPDAANKYITTYFRRSFNVTDATSISKLTMSIKRDDGVLIYLNGVEIGNDLLHAGLAPDASYTTVSANVADDGQTYIDVLVPPALLHDGVNIMAVELHQFSNGSSDISFDLGLVAQVGVPSVVANDTDIENSTLNAVLVRGPERGTLNLNANGGYVYTPFANFSGSDSFVYKANDGTLDSQAVLVRIDVTPINDAPVAANDTYTVAQNGTLTVDSPRTIQVSLAQTGDTWKYLDNGTNQGTAWRDQGFNDSAWASAASELGYGDGPAARKPP